MSYKSENWKEKLEQVRGHIALKEGSVILYDKHAGHKIEVEKETYHVIKAGDVVVVL